MEQPRDTSAKITMLVYVALVVGSGFFLLWLFVVEPRITAYLKAKWFNPYTLPDALAIVYLVCVAGLLPILLIFGGSVFLYKRWLLPQRGELAQEQLAKLACARHALTNAVSQIESFERELREKTTQAETLEQQLASLKSLNSETAAELSKKLQAVEIVNRSRIWFERVVSFLIGVASSLVAAYVWQFTQLRSSAETQSNPPLERRR